MPDPSRESVPWWRGAGAVAFVAATVGAIVGLHHATWQAIVEPGQVLGGVVEYPPDNVYHHRHLRAWSFTSQISAGFIAAGVSEKAISIAVSGLLGGAYSAIAGLLAFSLCRGFWLSLAASVSVYYVFGNSMPYNDSYPIVFYGTHHSNGILGQQMALLCVAMAGLGKPRLAAFCCGVAPAVHVTWGAWTLGVIGMALIWEMLATRGDRAATRRPADERPPDANTTMPRSASPFLRARFARLASSRWAAGFLAGGLVTAASLGWQLWLGRDLPVVSAEEQRRYLHAMLELWDFHRSRIVRPLDEGMLLVTASIVLSGCWLYRFRKSLPPDSARLLRILVISGILAYGMAAFAQWLPDIAIRTIPARFISLSLVAFPAVLLGMLGIASSDAGCRLLLAFHLCFLAGHRLVMPGVAWSAREAIAVGALAAVLSFANPRAEAARRLPRWLVIASATAFFVMAASVVRQAVREGEFAKIPGMNDAAIEAATRGEGMLIVAGDLELLQLKTRRPVLFFGWMLDDIVYFPSLGPASNRILKDVYEFDLFDSTEGQLSLHRGTLVPDPRPWERRGRGEWIDIGHRYGATQVLTLATWRLDLPIVAESQRLRLYSLPRDGDAARE
ncbi:MAG: hypothetical protein WD066_12410 [Planctomycetaceae bacterium]